MGIRRSSRPIARLRIERAALRLLDSSTLCAISTVSPRITAHINTAYFAWNHEFDVVRLSDPTARHSRNIHVRPTTAIAVYDSHQAWGKPDRGIQLLGSTRQLPRREAAAAERLRGALPGVRNARPERVPLLLLRGPAGEAV